MPRLSKTRFRPDLLVTSSLSPLDGLQRVFLVKDLRSNQVFRFDEREYFLCQAWNGQATLTEVQSAFRRQFQMPLALDHLEQFLHQLADSGLTEVSPPAAGNRPAKAPPVAPPSLWSLPLTPQRWKQGATGARQFCWLGTAAVWGVLPGGLLVIWTLAHNEAALQYDQKALFEIPYGHLFLLLHGTFWAVGLLSYSIQGLVLSYYGGQVTRLGIQLGLGFFPLIHIDDEGVERLPRREQLWVFGAPLLTRFWVLVGSVMLWHTSRVSGTSLHLWAILLGLAGLIELILDGSPLWLSNGYFWAVTYLRLPQLLYRSRLLWTMLLRRRPRPSALSPTNQVGLWLWGLLSAIASVLLWGYLVQLLSHSLGQILHGLLGNAAQPLILSLILGLFLRYLHKVWS